MTRSEYEKLYGKPELTPCKRCEGMIDTQRRRRLAIHKRRKNREEAIKAAKKSGKLIQVWFRDDFTGWHYIDYKGKHALTGRGEC